MNSFKNITKPLVWLLAIVMVVLTAACGNSSSESTSTTASKAITGYSLLGVAGTINETTKTISVPLPYGTASTALVATFTTTGSSVKVGTAVQVSGVTPNNLGSPVAYTVTASDGTTATYIVTVTVSAFTAKAITRFIVAGVTGTINEAPTPKTIAVTVPNGTNVGDLAATFTTTGASVKIGAVVQVSGQLPRNSFSAPVTYTVTAADNSTVDYVVTVTIAASSAKAITAFSLNGVTGTINEGTKTIAVTMPYGTNLSTTPLTATFTSTGFGSLKVNGVAQISGPAVGATTNIFSGPVAYVVTAADTTTVTYTVTVIVAPNSAKAITVYSINGTPGTINETAGTISVVMPAGTVRSSLAATFSTSGISVKVNTTAQTSGSTLNDFNNAVVYIVTAGDTTTKNYTVTVTVAVAIMDLRRTASFAVLSTGSSITATGTTTVTGDVGSTSFTGGGTLSFTAGNNYSSGVGQPFVDAQTDLPLVIADANNATLFPCGVSIAANLSGISLTPGVTCINADAAILNTGIVTLNGPGAYIIRTAGALTPAAGSSVAYGGGASNANTTVFWVVGSANLGSPSTWMGTILSAGAVTLGDTDTLVTGRVLSSAAVTLSNNTVTKP